MASHSAPLIAQVDLLIVGATTGAVEAALAAADRGAGVFVVSDRPYFGEESAGAFELAGERRPGPVKHALERRLLDRGIPFLFLTRPVAVLPDETGHLGGLVLASRTALYAVRAKAVLDLSPFGVAAGLPGFGLPRREPRIDAASLMVLASEGLALEGAVPAGEAEASGLRPFRITRPLENANSCAPAALEHRFRSALLDPAVHYEADAARWLGEGTPHEGRLWSHPSDLPESALRPHPRLFVLGNTSPLDGEGLRRLNDPAVQETMGRRLGSLAAEVVAGKGADGTLAPTPKGQGSYRFAPGYYRGTPPQVAFDLPAPPALGAYDVVVAGGGTGGAPAGIAAARAGAKCVVLEMQRGLGGVGTLGTIASYWFGNRVGFTEELDQALYAIDPAYRQTPPAIKATQWNPELKRAWYQRALLEAGGEAWLGSFAYGVRMEGEQVTGVLVSTPFGCGLLEARCVVDASGNADVAAAAGAPCRVIAAGHAATQGSGLSPRRPGIHYINSDFTFIDDTDVAGVTHAFVHARAKFRDDFDTIPFVNTRERRQIVGELELSPLDFLAGRRFPDVINIARSNFDTHGFVVHPVFLVQPPDHRPLEANVPLRCLLPQRIGGVLVTGLGISAHRDSLPVIRMQADVQNQGYAAGLAAAMAARRRGDFRALDVAALQRALVEKKILPPEVMEWRESFSLPGETVREAARRSPLSLFDVALLMAHPEESLPALRAALAAPEGETQREEAALVLGLMGDAQAAPALVTILDGRDWDEGWNYRGMGQFGMSSSRVDALLIALGRTRAAEGVPLVEKMIHTLGADPAFSHCRAVALAAASLGDSRLAAPLAEQLSQPGVSGHALTPTSDALSNANDDRVETLPRNRSLRELYLAKGLYLCGDCDGLGASILRQYCGDLHGLYSRHAEAVLAERDLERLRCESV